MNLSNIYYKLPVSLQNAACSFEGWRIRRNRYDAKFKLMYEELRGQAYISRDEASELRDGRLRKFIEWSVKTVPHYKKIFGELGIDPEDIQCLDDLHKLPIIEKRDVQLYPESFISRSIPKRQQVVCHTSGSTGAGLHVLATREAIKEQFAVYWRYLAWHGLTMDKWKGYFGGRSVVPTNARRGPYWRCNVPGRQVLYSGYHMSEATMPSYVENLNAVRPPWIVGYPSLISLLASHMLESGRGLTYQPEGIALSSENLMPAQVVKIERAFGVKPIQEYGQVEAVANISECEMGCLHVDEDFSAVEFIPIGDGMYRVVGTNFSNMAMPLIRYDTGDIVKLGETRCGCGRPGRVVESIDGRCEDFITLDDGTRVGRMDHIFKDMLNISEAQIYQCQPGKIELRIVKGAVYDSKDEFHLIDEVRCRVGDRCEVSVKYVDQITRTGRGKLRFVVSDVTAEHDLMNAKDYG